MCDGWEQDYGGSRADSAELKNYRRSFNKCSTRNWGTPESPGPTLGLEPDQHGSCLGTAFEFPEHQRAAVETLLKQREGKSFALVELPVRLADGREVNALIPVNDRTGRTYIGNEPLAHRAAMARLAQGTSGACVDYVHRIREELASLGIADVEVEEFLALVGPR